VKEAQIISSRILKEGMMKCSESRVQVPGERAGLIE
jgi:hypothetical protein